jgi:hypothetical protein
MSLSGIIFGYKTMLLKRPDFAIKSVCKRCMAETRVPLDHRMNVTREPVPWNESDESYWDDGVVICPNASRAMTPDGKQCLRQNEIEAIHSGCVSVWDHIRV